MFRASTVAGGVAFVAVAALLLSDLLTSHAAQNPAISLDMVTAGNSYDGATNTMAVGPIDNCLTTAAPGNNAQHTHQVHLIIQNVEDLVGWQVRLNYVGDKMRPSTFNPIPFTDNTTGQGVGFVNLPIDPATSTHRDVVIGTDIPPAAPGPQSAFFGAVYNGAQDFAISPDSPGKPVPDDTSYSAPMGGVLASVTLEVMAGNTAQQSLFMNLDDVSPNTPSTDLQIFNGSGITTLPLPVDQLGDGYHSEGATCVPLDCSTPECPPVAPAPTPGTPTPAPTPPPASPRELLFNPSDDAYVAADLPATNYRNATSLQADGSPIRHTYLKFDLRSLAGQTIVSADLRMFTTNASVAAQNVKSVADTTWTEATLNYNNRPAKGSTITSFTPNGPISTWVEVNLTSTVAAGRGSFLSLAMDTGSSDAYAFSSSEALSNGVYLDVQTGGTSSPTTTPGTTPTPTATPIPPNMTIVTASEDTYVSGASPTANFGTAPNLWADASPLQDTYMKFNLTHLAGQAVLSGKLRMWVTNGSGGVQNLKSVSDNGWSESLVTHGTAPAKGAVITTFVPGAGTGAWLEVDVTPRITAARGSFFSLALDTISTDGFGFNSKDSPADKLQLVITLSGPAPTPPSATPTATATATPTASPTPANMVAITPTDDTYVASDLPANGFGAAWNVVADGSPIRDAYLKFDLRSLAGQPIQSAHLWMWINNGSVGAQNIKSVADTSWSEMSITYNAPPAKGATITSFKPGAGTLAWTKVDLTSTVAAAAGSRLALALDTISTDGFGFNSKDSPENQVRLEVLLTGTPGPTATLSSTPTSTPTPTPMVGPR